MGFNSTLDTILASTDDNNSDAVASGTRDQTAGRETINKGRSRRESEDSASSQPDADANVLLDFRWSTVLGNQLCHIYCEEDSLVNKEMLSSAETSHALSPDLQLLLLYFSSRWCPVCVEFDVTMIDVYAGLKYMPESSKAEIIWVSCDVTEEAYLKHLSKLGGMYALPWKLNRSERLAEFLGVQGLPALVVLDAKSGACLTCWGREDVVAAVDEKCKTAMNKGLSRKTIEDSANDASSIQSQTPTVDLATPSDNASNIPSQTPTGDLATASANALNMQSRLCGIAVALFERWRSLLPPASSISEGKSQWQPGKMM
mmetsp:Transcript_120427/g.239673  ORF Transcript_120427/g.239673 Transcript_120427/m.239673 type:complete len:316 (+) Transcript_120427:74-1021(+)